MSNCRVVAEMYTGEALEWARIGCDLAKAASPDDAFRTAAAKKKLEFFTM